MKNICQNCGVSCEGEYCEQCKKDFFEIERHQKEGHTYHCSCRLVWGDGECECGLTDYIPGDISRSMYRGLCPVCLIPEGSGHEKWCRNNKPV